MPLETLMEGLGRCEICKKIVVAKTNADNLVCNMCAEEMHREWDEEVNIPPGMEELR